MRALSNLAAQSVAPRARTRCAPPPISAETFPSTPTMTVSPIATCSNNQTVQVASYQIVNAVVWAGNPVSTCGLVAARPKGRHGRNHGKGGIHTHTLR